MDINWWTLIKKGGLTTKLKNSLFFLEKTWFLKLFWSPKITHFVAAHLIRTCWQCGGVPSVFLGSIRWLFEENWFGRKILIFSWYNLVFLIKSCNLVLVKFHDYTKKKSVFSLQINFPPTITSWSPEKHWGHPRAVSRSLSDVLQQNESFSAFKKASETV